MKLELIKPIKALNKAYPKEKVSRNHIELFKKNLQQLLSRINEQESEEHLKNVIADFFKGYLVLILFALIIYPVLGYFIGHVYPFSPTFGLPCPTTIFTFGLLLLNSKRCPVTILIIPLVWSIIGFMAAIQFGILEDTGLLVAGLITISLLLYRNRMLIIHRKYANN